MKRKKKRQVEAKTKRESKKHQESLDRAKFGFYSKKKIKKLKKTGNWTKERQERHAAGLKAFEVELRKRNDGVTTEVAAQQSGDDRMEIEDPKRQFPLVLFSKKGTRLDQGTNYCSVCFARWSVVWEYRESTWGPVALCGRCKGKVFDRSFHKVDALSDGVKVGTRKKKFNNTLES